jgi:hypothetical protein
MFVSGLTVRVSTCALTLFVGTVQTENVIAVLPKITIFEDWGDKIVLFHINALQSGWKAIALPLLESNPLGLDRCGRAVEIDWHFRGDEYAGRCMVPL